jgi:nitroimidazol reductase NimA-like FMN-containing flavoprotein (pyridoxamine 5'-phosphate oxidase superfamily)
MTMRIFNASPGFGAPLTEEEVKDFLTNSKLNVHLGTVDEKGDSNIHPVWYYFDNSNNKLYTETSKSSKKTDNLRRNNTIYYCIDEANPPYKGVRGKGKVRILEGDINHNIPIAEKIIVKYLGSLDNPIARSLIDGVKKGDSVILEITPSYYSTWDYSKRRRGGGEGEG